MKSLAERVAESGPLSTPRAVGWTIRLAKRIEALHALGLMHGSVSPEAIFAADLDPTSEGMLASARRKCPAKVQSFERALGMDISESDDTWAVAATLHLLLTGVGPYTGPTELDILAKIKTVAPTPLAVFDVGDDEIQRILDEAFCRDKKKRTTSVAELRMALERWDPQAALRSLPPLGIEGGDVTEETTDDRTVLYVTPPAAMKDEPSHDEEAKTVMAEVPAHVIAALRASTGPARPGLSVTDEDSEDARTVLREAPLGSKAPPLPGPPLPPLNSRPSFPQVAINPSSLPENRMPDPAEFAVSRESIEAQAHSERRAIMIAVGVAFLIVVLLAVIAVYYGLSIAKE